MSVWVSSFPAAEMGSWICEMIAEVLRKRVASEKIEGLVDYVDDLEAEKKKIDAFKRELPLCMGILENAIAAGKDELTQCDKSNAVPVLEEFLPLRKTTDGEAEKIESVKEENDFKSKEKMNWINYVQPRTSSNLYPNSNQASKLDNVKSCKNRITESASWPFKGCTNFPVLPAVKEDEDESTMVPVLSLGTTEIINSSEEINWSDFRSKSSCRRSESSSYVENHLKMRAGQQAQQITRKQRRCWSPELHRLFVDALQQLGGAQAATPKQIRELMQVDGLSNDEVKSHLQKYRIHARRVDTPTRTNHPIDVGASWMSSQEQCCDSLKRRNSWSRSPQDHSHLAGFSLGPSLTEGDCVEEEDDEKCISHIHSWKNEIQLSLGG